jgi:futalosine hydrolase
MKGGFNYFKFMKILIVAATWMEVELLAEEFEFEKGINHSLEKYRYNNTEIDILISGIGTTFTTFHLTKTLKETGGDPVLRRFPII